MALFQKAGLNFPSNRLKLIYSDNQQNGFKTVGFLRDHPGEGQAATSTLTRTGIFTVEGDRDRHSPILDPGVYSG
jgi:hypothetical protein